MCSQASSVGSVRQVAECPLLYGKVRPKHEVCEGASEIEIVLPGHTRHERLCFRVRSGIAEKAQYIMKPGWVCMLQHSFKQESSKVSLIPMFEPMFSELASNYFLRA